MKNILTKLTKEMLLGANEMTAGPMKDKHYHYKI